MMALVVLIIMLILLIPIALIIVSIVGEWKIFEKAGIEGWKALIPFYSEYVLVVDVAKMNWWWFLIILLGAFIPYVGSLAVLFASVNVNYIVAKRFTNEESQIVLTCIFPNIMYCVFGFGKATYSDEPMSKNGFIPEEYTDGNNGAKNASYTDKKEKNGFCTNCGSQVYKGDKFCTKCGKEVHR